MCTSSVSGKSHLVKEDQFVVLVAPGEEHHKLAAGPPHDGPLLNGPDTVLRLRGRGGEGASGESEGGRGNEPGLDQRLECLMSKIRVTPNRNNAKAKPI